MFRAAACYALYAKCGGGPYRSCALKFPQKKRSRGACSAEMEENDFVVGEGGEGEGEMSWLRVLSLTYADP